MARYTLLVDGISKAFAATGLRVGWGFGPVDVIARMAAILGHIGAWAPRPEQAGTIAFLRDEAALREHRDSFARAVGARLDRLHRGLASLESEGLPVKSLPPMGAIYLAAHFDVQGKSTPAGRRAAHATRTCGATCSRPRPSGSCPSRLSGPAASRDGSG